MLHPLEAWALNRFFRCVIAGDFEQARKILSTRLEGALSCGFLSTVSLCATSYNSIADDNDTFDRKACKRFGVEILEQQVKTNNSTAKLFLSEVYLLDNRNEEALTLALEAEPPADLAWMRSLRMAEAFLALGRFEEAEPLLLRLTSRGKSGLVSYTLQNRLAQLYYKQGRHAECVKAMARAVKAFPPYFEDLDPEWQRLVREVELDEDKG